MTTTDEAGDTRVFARPPRRDGAAMGRLRSGLAARAQQEELLDVAYRTVETPVGRVLLAATQEGLVKVAFAVQDHDAVLQHLSDAVSPRILSAPRRLDETSRQLDEYFAGRRRRFELPLDWRLSKGFRRDVLARLPEIGYGRTESYAQVAAAAAQPQGGTRGGHRLRDQPAAAGGAVPPRRPL